MVTGAREALGRSGEGGKGAALGRTNGPLGAAGTLADGAGAGCGAWTVTTGRGGGTAGRVAARSGRMAAPG